MRVRFGFLAAVLIAAFGSPAGAAAQGGFGLGGVIGEPTGVTARFMKAQNNFQVHAAWSFTNNDAFQISGDYLRSGDIDTEPMIPFYYGVGAVVKFSDETVLGVRVPLGLNYFLKGEPVEIFGEAVPILRLIPKTDFNFGLAAGVRYYFGR